MRLRLILIPLLWFFQPSPAWTAEDAVIIRDWLVIERVGQYGRSPLFVDPIESLRIDGKWTTPRAGDVVTGADGKDHVWRTLRAAEDGSIKEDALAGGYTLARIDFTEERVMILHASGHAMVYVNGEPRAGDPYQAGFVRLPVLMKKGNNELLFHCARGELRATLEAPTSTQPYFDPADATLPDFRKGHAQTLPFAVVMVNPTNQSVVVHGQRILPLSIRKIRLNAEYDGTGTEFTDKTTKLAFRVREPGQTFKRTFISDIDGSVQYYAVNPAAGAPAGGGRAVVLSLHGAGVEAINQADAYAPKTDCDIVCPTNRRPYGFDWEDWGRLDALEVLADAKKLLHPDESRIYLTGHSMGGHGTWIIGALFPDQFAAIAPSAGWISFATYATTRTVATQPESGPREVLRRCASVSDTSIVFPNLAHLGIYILHGADDDNVPADQARQMVKKLSEFHHDFVYHEQKDAGHWWDSSEEPGAACVDWPAMFDFFARHRRPDSAQVRHVAFVTPAPSVSSRCHWIMIDAQERAMSPSSVDIQVEPGARRYFGTTKNVARLAIDLVHLAGQDRFQIELDQQSIPDVILSPDRRAWLEKKHGQWTVIDRPSPRPKGAHRSGLFKDAFRNRFIMVYGTHGTPDENAWALAKARYDAETWWYRGNGSVEVVADTDLDPTRDPDGNLILYGNAKTVSCWEAVVGKSIVCVKDGMIQLGLNIDHSDSLGCLIGLPRLNSDVGLVGIVGGTGLRGMRTIVRMPVFLSGIAYPDFAVFSPDGARIELKRAAFSENDWSVTGVGEVR